MTDLNLPPIQLKIKEDMGKKYVLDRLRRQFVRLTPEEFVRQSFIGFLIGYLHYPEGLLANEVCIELGSVNRRCDTILYDKFLQPQMIIEYKAPSVTISQAVFDQITRYNKSLSVPWLVVSNGLQHFCCKVNSDGSYAFLKEIPDYAVLNPDI